jgi:hypothetical protein
MPKIRPTEADLEKAREIVERHRPFVGAFGSMPDNIARAVAEGIVQGRMEGIQAAIDTLTRLKAEG